MDFEATSPVEDAPSSSFVEVEDPARVSSLSPEEVETMVGLPSDDAEDDLPVEKLVRQWPDLATVRAERYRKEVNSIRERFHEEPEDDMNMCSEYAEEIFQYMTDLEVC